MKIYIITNFIRKIAVLIRISRLEIDKKHKYKILKTWVKVFIFKKYDYRNKIADIVGYRIKFLNFSCLECLFEEIFISNEYFFVSDNRNPYIIDCGSNIGISVLFFKMLYSKSRVLAFEPDRTVFSCLKANVENNFPDSVNIVKAALSNKQGIISFYSYPEHLGSLAMSTKKNRVSDRIVKDKIKVESKSLSEYLEEPVDFLKIDIEGNELEVIEELSNKNKLRLVKQMVIECHHNIFVGENILSKILEVLEKEGFGYQIQGEIDKPLKADVAQDVLVYAYKTKLN